MPLKTFATNDVLAAADLNNGPYSDAVTADVVTSQTTTSLSYTDLSTVGPAVTITLANGQGCLVIISARMNHSAGGGQAALASFAVTGATSLSAIDANSIETQVTGVGGTTCSRPTWFVAGASGSHTFTMKYQVQSGGTGTYFNRRILVKKF